MDLAYSWFTQADQIHWDSSFIMTPSGPFIVTRTWRTDHSFRFIPQADTFSLMSGSFISHADLYPPRARTFFVCADHSLSYPDHFNSRGSRWIFSGHFRFACRPFSQPADLFLLQTLSIISIMTRANRVDSLGSLNGSCQARALLRWTFFDRADLLTVIYVPLPLHADRC